MRIYGDSYDNAYSAIETIYTVKPTHDYTCLFYSEAEKIDINTDVSIDYSVWKFFDGKFKFDYYLDGETSELYANDYNSATWFKVTDKEVTLVEKGPEDYLNNDQLGDIYLYFENGEYKGFELDEW